MCVLGREFLRGKKEDVTLENFNLCGKAIPQLEGSKAFKYLEKQKAPASARTNKKPTLPCGSNKKRREVHERKCILAKFKTRVVQLETPHI